MEHDYLDCRAANQLMTCPTIAISCIYCIVPLIFSISWFIREHDICTLYHVMNFLKSKEKDF